MLAGLGALFIWGNGLVCSAYAALCLELTVWSGTQGRVPCSLWASFSLKQWSCLTLPGWVWLGWCLSLNLPPPRSVMHGWGGLEWFQLGCLDAQSGSSSADTRDYRYLISLYLLIASPGSSARCNPESSADRGHFLQQIPQPVNLWLGSCGKLQGNNSWCSYTFH